MDFEAEKKEMAETQLHFIKYASEEIIEYIQMGGTVEEWYQNKLSKVHSDMEGLHSWIEGEKRRTGMVEETELEEASLRKRIAQRGRIETKLLAMKDDDAKMAAFLINQDDQKELAKFLKSLDPKSRKAIEAVMNEGYVSHAQRKAVWASRNDEEEKKKMKKEGTDFAAHRAAQSTAPTQADREKMRKVAQLLAKERKMKKEELEAVDEAKYGDTGWRKVSGPRKDKYGNIVKNAAKHLAKKGMAAAQSDNDKKKMQGEEVEQIDEAKDPLKHMLIPRGEAGKAYASKKAAQRQAQADKNDPGSKGKHYGPAVVDREKAAKKARAKGIDKRAAQIVMNYKRKLPEEVEQVDEAKKVSLVDVSVDVNRLKDKGHEILRAYERRGDIELEDDDEWDDGNFVAKNPKVAEKLKKDLAKHGAKVHVKVYYESVEQVDEISKKTLGSYLKKAHRDGVGAARVHRSYDGNDHATKANLRTMTNRRKGIDRATDRLTKEEVELDEAQYKVPSNYAAMMLKKKRAEKKKLSAAQSKHMDTDKDGDIDGKDLKNLRNKK